MSRYIDADAAVKRFEELHGSENTLLNSYNADWIISFIETQPTVDVVEIVRCADCKYWDAVKNPKYKDTGICVPPRKDLGGYCVRRGATNCNDFCSQGERIKDNAEVH